MYRIDRTRITRKNNPSAARAAATIFGELINPARSKFKTSGMNQTSAANITRVTKRYIPPLRKLPFEAPKRSARLVFELLTSIPPHFFARRICALHLLSTPTGYSREQAISFALSSAARVNCAAFAVSGSRANTARPKLTASAPAFMRGTNLSSSQLPSTAI